MASCPPDIFLAPYNMRQVGGVQEHSHAIISLLPAWYGEGVPSHYETMKKYQGSFYILILTRVYEFMHCELDK